jgi:hypothetical protein
MQCKHPFTHNGMLLPCGKCVGCRIAKSREWTYRLTNEMQNWKDAVFITLTYDEQNLPKDGKLQKIHLQKYFRAMRKRLKSKGRNIKYFAAGEYGDDPEKKRPHYHAIVFGIGLAYGDRIHMRRRIPPHFDDIVQESWNRGLVWTDDVVRKSIGYVTDYVHKKYLDKYKEHNIEPPFQLVSQGIGKQYALQNADILQSRLGDKFHGNDVSLPRYYRRILDIPPEPFQEEARKRRKEITDIYKENGATYLHYLINPIISADLDAVNRWQETKLNARTNLKPKGNL